MSSDLLLEIGVEELPSALIEIGRRQMPALTEAGLAKARLPFASIQCYSTPRRLAVIVSAVGKSQEAQLLEVKGPAAAAAYDAEGAPTKAAMGFAASQGIDVGSLEVRDVNGGSYVFAVKQAPEGAATAVLPGLCQEVVDTISFPKSMRWGSGRTKFARPIRWVCCMYGTDVVEFSLESVSSGRSSAGHRLLSPERFEVGEPATYVEQLRERMVLCDPDERREKVLAEIESAALAGGGKPYIDPDVLLEVVNLVEHPQGLRGAFATEFLTIPNDVIKTAMQSHQRYFPVEAESGELLPAFIVVQNGDPEFGERIKHGHERVLRARLADGAFFFMEDSKTTLESKVDQLAGVVFQAKLGSMLDKTKRLSELSARFGGILGFDKSELAAMGRAALLCKADLVTAMVGEFPELQGVVGREYATVDGEDPAAAVAIYEHYLPRFAGDDLAGTPAGRALSVADKMDSVVGFFMIGLPPTGSEDPYSLRRQAHGVILTAIEAGWDVSITELIEESVKIYGAAGVETDQQTAQAIKEFFAARLGKHLTGTGYSAAAVAAVMAAGHERMGEMLPRLDTLMSADTAAVLTEAKLGLTRCENLADADAGRVVDPGLFQHVSESELYQATEKAYKRVAESVSRQDFAAALEAMAVLRPSIDTFFDGVMVMDEDPRVRNNRLALLNMCVSLGRMVCDFSKLP